MDLLGLKLLCPKQYAMCYRSLNDNAEPWRTKLGQFSDTMYAVVAGQDQNIPLAERMLPLAFMLENGTAAVLRQKLVVVDSTRFSPEKIHNKQYAELLLYTAWKNESVAFGPASHDGAVCAQLHQSCRNHISDIKEGLRQFLMQHKDHV